MGHPKAAANALPPLPAEALARVHAVEERVRGSRFLCADRVGVRKRILRDVDAVTDANAEAFNLARQDVVDRATNVVHSLDARSDFRTKLIDDHRSDCKSSACF